jgi:hypothetical protein
MENPMNKIDLITSKLSIGQYRGSGYGKSLSTLTYDLCKGKTINVKDVRLQLERAVVHYCTDLI